MSFGPLCFKSQFMREKNIFTQPTDFQLGQKLCLSHLKFPKSYRRSLGVGLPPTETPLAWGQSGRPLGQSPRFHILVFFTFFHFPIYAHSSGSLAKHLLINLVLLVMMTEVIRMEETVRFPTLVNCFGPWRASCLSICLYFSLHQCLGCIVLSLYDVSFYL